LTIVIGMMLVPKALIGPEVEASVALLVPLILV
jgi:hypothetical protein